MFGELLMSDFAQPFARGRQAMAARDAGSSRITRQLSSGRAMMPFRAFPDGCA
jgi:hypothetical protein